MVLAAWLCPALAFAQAPSADRMRTRADEKPRLAVSQLEAQGVEPTDAAAVTDAVVSSLTERALFQVLSSKDIESVVAAARNRQLLGQCARGPGDPPSCATDLGELLGAPFVMTGSLSKIGTAYQLNLQTLDTVKGTVVGRSLRLAGDLQTLIAVVPYAAAEATGSPLPPPRSRVAQYAMMAGGAGLVVGGGFVGMMALSRQAVLNQQLCPPSGVPASDGSCHGENLLPMAAYQAENQALGVQKTVSLAMLGVGTALIGAGILLLPPPEQGGPRVALVPSAGGAALVGVWP